MDRDRGRRYDDGEVVRYGAGESWRPTPRGGAASPGDRNNRSPPRRPRSPIPRDRDRSRPPRSPRPLRSPRPRSPPGPSSDSYVPGRPPPRRRSPSRGPIPISDRYRRDRSRDRDSPPRRRERTRSPIRRGSPPRRSISRRPSPPRRHSPVRLDRYDRPRSPPPRRDWARDRDFDRDGRRDPERDRPWKDRDLSPARGRDSERFLDRRDDSFVRRSPIRGDMVRDRRRSRSPIRRERSPMGRRTPLSGGRGGSYRPSRSPSRRPERYQGFRRSPARDSNLSSAMNSRPESRRPSPGPVPRNRSPLPSRDHSPSHRAPISREASRATLRDDNNGSAPKSPPRGPAALRAPPTGPAASRTYSNSSHPSTPGANRPDITSPTSGNPPAGPRGYVASSRGGYASRGGRGSWTQSTPRQMSTGRATSPPGGAGGLSAIPTGPRASSAASSSTPTQGRPFNPPTGPSAGAPPPRQSLAQSLLATLPPIVPGGKIDPAMTPMALGVSRELEPHYRKLRDEEEKLRDELRAKQERLRKSLYTWDRMGRESAAWQLRSDLSERSMINLAGDGAGGAAF